MLAKLGKFFTVNILGILLSPTEAVGNLDVWFDSDFPSLVMSGIPEMLVLFVSGILSDLGGISCMEVFF